MQKQLSPEGMKEFEWLLTRYPKRRAAMLPTLRLIEKEFGKIDLDGLKLCAELIQTSPADVYGVVSFYTHYKCDLPGRKDGDRVIWLCHTLPCALKGCKETLQALEKALDVHTWGTTKDGKFTLKKAECLASCDTAPCLQIDDDHYDHVTPDKVEAILAKYR